MPNINDVYANLVNGKEHVVTGILKEEVHGKEGVILDNAKEITYRGLAANFRYIGKKLENWGEQFTPEQKEKAKQQNDYHKKVAEYKKPRRRRKK